MDIHIDNAIDLWKDGAMLPEWDPELVKRYIRMAERAKIRFLRIFPLYLGMSVFILLQGTLLNGSAPG